VSVKDTNTCYDGIVTLKMDKQDEDKLKQQVSQMVFDIKRHVRKKAYWNATKVSHELFELLNKQPYIEEDNL
jgi:hypothetical protein